MLLTLESHQIHIDGVVFSIQTYMELRVNDGNMSLIMPFGVFHLLTSDGTMTYSTTYYACAPKQISSQMPRHRC